MRFRAERVDGLLGAKTNGFYVIDSNKREKFRHIIIPSDTNPYCHIPIKPETLEILLFGEWWLVSELEKPEVISGRKRFEKDVCEWKLDNEMLEEYSVQCAGLCYVKKRQL